MPRMYQNLRFIHVFWGIMYNTPQNPCKKLYCIYVIYTMYCNILVIHSICRNFWKKQQKPEQRWLVFRMCKKYWCSMDLEMSCSLLNKAQHTLYAMSTERHRLLLRLLLAPSYRSRDCVTPGQYQQALDKKLCPCYQAHTKEHMRAVCVNTRL